MRKILIALGMASMVFATSACNTVRGMGQDLESVANDADKAI
ncbi:MAG: Entericidin EcnA/B family protein [Sphingomonadaceae bacterium]|nr:Entericidin EcnA/B family protein [Sphingomonadaceae bacterium]